MAEIFFRSGVMSEKDAAMLNPLQLAYVGDAVYELFVRTRLSEQGERMKNLHRMAVSRVNADAQSSALDRISDLLTETEQDVVRRGRNAHAHHSAPKNAAKGAYPQATGLEALLGYLFLSGQDERLEVILERTEESADASGETEG